MGQTTAAQGSERSVSLRRAARRAGLSVESFKAAADALDGTPEDLRAPGFRIPATYDPERLRQWIQAFRLPGVPLAGPDSPVPVTASCTGTVWVLQVTGRDLSATAPRLITAKRRLAQELAPVLGKEPAVVDFEISWDLGPAAMQLWTESLEFRDLARQLIDLAAHKGDTAIAMLTGQGMTGPEVGAALGLSHQRVQQLLARGNARDLEASGDSTR